MKPGPVRKQPSPSTGAPRGQTFERGGAPDHLSSLSGFLVWSDGRLFQKITSKTIPAIERVRNLNTKQASDQVLDGAPNSAETKTIKELKPNKKRAIARGLRQLGGYPKELKKVKVKGWKGDIETY